MFSKGGKKSYYNRSWRSYSRKYPYYKGSGVVRRSLAAAKSFKTGTKNQYFNCSVNGFVNFNVDAGEFNSDIVRFSPYMGKMTMTGSGSSASYTINDSNNTLIHGGAVLDRTFRLMCSQYDQVKLVSMKVKLQPTNSYNYAFKLASIIDRNYKYDEAVADIDGSSMVENEKVTSKGIFSNPGASIQTFNANRIYPLARYCSSSDLKEKSDFVDSTIKYFGTTSASPLQELILEDWYDDDTHFSPCFFYSIQVNSAPAASGYIGFSYSCEYNFVFRNAKNTLDRFLTLEARGYVNPDGRSLVSKKESGEQKIYKPLEEVMNKEDDVLTKEAVEPKG